MRSAVRELVVALAFAAAAGVPSLAAAAVEVVQSGTVHDVWFATSFEGASGLVVGAQGKVLTTQDGGKTWAAGSVGTPLALLGAHADAQRRLAVGQSGLIFLQGADGKWAKVESGSDKRLFGVDANAAGLAVAVGEFGGVLVSDDGGATWRALTIDWAAFSQDGAEPHLYGVDVATDGAITMIGEFGLVLRSTDRGQTWTATHKGDASLFGLLLRDDGSGFAVGQDGTVLRTADRGLTWSDVASGTKTILLGVAESTSGQVGISGMREMLVSSDGGATFGRVSEPELSTFWYASIAPAADGGFLAVGQAGRVARIGADASAAVAAAPATEAVAEASAAEATESAPEPANAAVAEASAAEVAPEVAAVSEAPAAPVAEATPAPAPKPAARPKAKAVKASPAKPVALTAWWPSERAGDRLNLTYAGEASFGSAIAVLFDRPLTSAQSANQHIRVLDAGGSPVKGAWALASNKQMLVFPARSGRYTLVVAGDLDDGNGKTLGTTLKGPVAVTN
jgi:photosystem II stability/assembly factor-like uncharacterized protein